MDEKWIEQIRRNLDLKSTEELLQIWHENDREEWSDEAFIAIGQILDERGENRIPEEQTTEQDMLAQSSQRQRPGCVTAFAILMGLGAILYALGSLVEFYAYYDYGDQISLVITLAFAGLSVAIAAGLWFLKNWARIALIVLQSLNILIFIGMLFSGGLFPLTLVGLIANGLIIYWFATHGEYFRPEATRGITETLSQDEGLNPERS